MGAYDNMKKRAHIIWSFVIAHLPRTNSQGLKAVSSTAFTTMLFIAGCAMLLYASLLATPAWAASSTEDTEADVGDNTVNARQIADNSFLYDTSIYELSQADTTYQGNTVQVVGEVIGESIRAADGPDKCWITLEAMENEYESSISVLIDEADLGLIDTYGGYNSKGTTLQVRGIFYLACPSHEGIMDIHAENVTLVAKGSTTKDVFALGDFLHGAILVTVGLVLTLVYRYLRERER